MENLFKNVLEQESSQEHLLSYLQVVIKKANEFARYEWLTEVYDYRSRSIRSDSVTKNEAINQFSFLNQEIKKISSSLDFEIEKNRQRLIDVMLSNAAIIKNDLSFNEASILKTKINDYLDVVYSDFFNYYKKFLYYGSKKYGTCGPVIILGIALCLLFLIPGILYFVITSNRNKNKKAEFVSKQNKFFDEIVVDYNNLIQKYTYLKKFIAVPKKIENYKSVNLVNVT